jgi:hypothetical protein
MNILKSNNYFPLEIKNFDEIQQSLLAKYKNYLDCDILFSETITWTRENFLELHTEIEQHFLKSDSKILRSRFFLTPAGRELDSHIDGSKPNEAYWALNIPIFCDSSDHWQEWFDYNGEMDTVSDEIYTSYIMPKDRTQLVSVDKLTLTTPHFVKIGKFHGIVNRSTLPRLVLSIRFSTNNIEKLISGY